jgi:hypothetical protein
VASRRRRRAIFALQAAIMAMAGAIVGMFYWISLAPRPRLVALWVARHPSGQLPSPPLAAFDFGNLAGRWYFPGGGRARPEANLTRQGFTRELRALASVDSRATLVVYVRANATVLPWRDAPDAATKAGSVPSASIARVFVLPADADPARPATWVPLREVLQALSACRAAHRLLVLDLNPLSLPRAGALDRDVAAAIPDELKEVADTTRIVLTSCSAGEVPLASDDIGRSVFSYYFEEGLRGWADGFGGEADGTVSVAELARFVTQRIDRWAQRNRSVRQQPVLDLRDSRDDFPLVVLDRGLAQPHLKLAPERDLAKSPPLAYPESLVEAWSGRDRWVQDGRARRAPWAFRAMEARLLRAEEDWRNGAELATVEKDWNRRLDALNALWSPVLARRRPPQVRSLALAASLEIVPDAGLQRDVAALCRELILPSPALKPDQAEAARDARVKAFVDAHKSDPDLDLKLARAVLAAGAQMSATVETVRELDRVLRAAVTLQGRGGMPPVEALAVSRLAPLAAGWTTGPARPDWPADAAHQALVFAERETEIGASPRALPWVGPVLEEAERDRHDADVLLRERGYAPLAAARDEFGRASALYETALAGTRTVASAFDTLTAALEVLPPSAGVLDDLPALEDGWLEASERTRALADGLTPPREPLRSPAELTPTIEVIRQRAENLRANLETVRDALSRQTERLLTIESATGPEGDGDGDNRAGHEILEIDALLATVLPKAAERKALWDAARRRARPLLRTSMEDDQNPAVSVEAPPEEQPDEAVGPPVARLAPHARRAIALLGLAGFDPAALDILSAQLDPDPATNPATALSLTGQIRADWDSLVRESPGETSVNDRVGRVLPALEPSPALDNPNRNPIVVRRTRTLEALWLWLADRYSTEAADLGGEPALADSAASLRDLAVSTLDALGLAAIDPDRARRRVLSPFVEGAGAAAELSRERPSATVPVRLRVADGAAAWKVEPVGVDERWLRVRPVSTSTETDAYRRSFVVELAPGAGKVDGAIPEGFLLRAALPGEHFHTRIPITFQLDTTQPQVLLGAEPDHPPPSPRGELRLRPIPGVQLFHLFLRNPADRPRRIEVELRAGDQPVPGGSGIVTLDRAETKRIEFSPPAAAAPPAAGQPSAPPTTPAPSPAAAELPELTGPLAVQLRDPATGRVLAMRRISVVVASARDYVRVGAVRFEPPGPGNGGKNRLSVTLQATAGFSGPPCVARLVLDPDRIPGLRAVNDSTARGVMGKPGDSVTLTASELDLDPTAASEIGSFAVDIDDLPRAFVFRGVFAREGDATTPHLDFTPDLRVRSGEVSASGGQFAATLEVDNPPPGARLEVRLGREGLGGFSADRTLPSRPAARRRIGFALHDKALAFTASAADWSVPIDSEGVEGRRLIQVKLLDRQGRVIKDGQLIKEVFRPVAFDRSPPAGVHLINAPKRAKPSTVLTLRATAGPSVSGIKRVVFFLGKLSADGKLPIGGTIIEGAPLPNEKDTWWANLPLPAAEGATDVSVAFYNAVGLVSSESVNIVLVGGEIRNPGRITGRVVERGVSQPGLTVQLADSRGMRKDETTSDTAGKFAFEAVERGPYRVLARNPATPSRGDAVVEVKDGQTVTLELNLKYGR